MADEMAPRGHGASQSGTANFQVDVRMFRLGMRDRSWLTLWESCMIMTKYDKEGTTGDHERLKPPRVEKTRQHTRVVRDLSPVSHESNQLGWLAREDLLCHCLHLQVSCLLHGLHRANPKHD